MNRVGFVGLGTMGLPMAGNLIKKGFALSVYNRTAAKIKPLVDEGAAGCDSPASVGAQSEVVVTCVSDAPDVEEVIMGADGVASKMADGGLIIDCSTSSPELARSMHTQLKERGIGILDAPVSGGPEGARQGTLAIMVGGDDADFEKGLPVLQAMGKSVTHVGPAGSGQLTKAVNQIITALNLATVAEGVALARKSGIDPDKVLEAIMGGAAGSWILTNRGPLMTKEEFEPARFALNLHKKDLRIAMETAKSNNLNLPLAEKAHEMLKTLIDKGYGHLDHSAMYLYVKENNKL